MRVLDKIKQRRERLKGEYPHTSFFDFCKALPENDGRWLWWNLWLIMAVEGVLFVLLGVAWGLAIGGHIK